MLVTGFLGMFGPTELVIILVLVLILFGAGRLPQVLEQFGKGIKAFRDASKDGGDDDEAIEVTKSKREIASNNEVSEAEEVKSSAS